MAVRSFARRYQAPLTRGLPGEDLDDVVRRSPGPGVWSRLLEYGAHIGDIFEVFDDRVRCALVGREPDQAEVDWEGRVAAASATLDRVEVVERIADAADTLATTLDELNGDEWQLMGVTGRGSSGARGRPRHDRRARGQPPPPRHGPRCCAVLAAVTAARWAQAGSTFSTAATSSSPTPARSAARSGPRPSRPAATRNFSKFQRMSPV